MKGVQKFVERKGKFEKIGPQKGKNIIAKIQCYVHYKKYCPKIKKGNNNKDRKESHFTEEVEEVEKNKS